MRASRILSAGSLTAMMLTGVMVGCGNASSPPPERSGSPTAISSTKKPDSPAQPGPNDYTALLIKASDIDAPMPMIAGPPTSNPGGQPGAAITFSSQPHPKDQDGVTVKEVHIVDTIRVLPDPPAADNALKSAKAGQSSVKDPKEDPATVGNGATMLSGTSPDGSKAVTVLMFTEGRGFVTLEFVGEADSPPPPPDFVIDVGQKQAAALKSGLGG